MGIVAVGARLPQARACIVQLPRIPVTPACYRPTGTMCRPHPRLPSRGGARRPASHRGDALAQANTRERANNLRGSALTKAGDTYHRTAPWALRGLPARVWLLVSSRVIGMNTTLGRGHAYGVRPGELAATSMQTDVPGGVKRAALGVSACALQGGLPTKAGRKTKSGLHDAGTASRPNTPIRANVSERSARNERRQLPESDGNRLVSRGDA